MLRVKIPGEVMRRMPFAAAAVLLAGGAVWYLYPQSQPPVQIPSPPSLSFLVAFGIGGTAGVNWDGTVTATGGTIQSLQGWRFSGADSIQGTTGWKLSTRLSAA